MANFSCNKLLQTPDPGVRRVKRMPLNWIRRVISDVCSRFFFLLVIVGKGEEEGRSHGRVFKIPARGRIGTFKAHGDGPEEIKSLPSHLHRPIHPSSRS